VLNKQGQFGAKIFLHYADIVIFMLGYFILAHPCHYGPSLIFRCLFSWK